MRFAKSNVLFFATVLMHVATQGVPAQHWYSAMSTQQWKQSQNASKLLLGASTAAICIGGALYLHKLWCELGLASYFPKGVQRQQVEDVAAALRYERKRLGSFLEGAACVLVMSGILLAVTSSAHHCSLLSGQLRLLQK